MNPSQCDEDLRAEIDRVKKLMFASDDPASYNYERKLVRPQINWLRIVLRCTAVVAGIIALVCVLKALSVDEQLINRTCFACFAGVILLELKRILICMVRIYQRYAPDAVRNKCRFEPSCSEYMILSLEKYGLFKGLYKGIRRLARCNIHNGGYDYP